MTLVIDWGGCPNSKIYLAAPKLHSCYNKIGYRGLYFGLNNNPAEIQNEADFQFYWTYNQCFNNLSVVSFLVLGKKKKPKQLMHESTSGCASLGAQMVKNLPAVQETQFQPLTQEDPLEKGMAMHSSILTWRIPWTEEPGELTAHGVSISQT